MSLVFTDPHLQQRCLMWASGIWASAPGSCVCVCVATGMKVIGAIAAHLHSRWSHFSSGSEGKADWITPRPSQSLCSYTPLLLIRKISHLNPELWKLMFALTLRQIQSALQREWGTPAKIPPHSRVRCLRSREELQSFVNCSESFLIEKNMD